MWTLAPPTMCILNIQTGENTGYKHGPCIIKFVQLSDPEGSSLKIEQCVADFHTYMSLAELYNVYYRIHCFVEQPFTSHVPEALHNMARYLIHRIMKTTPPGISKVYPLCMCVCVQQSCIQNRGGGGVVCSSPIPGKSHLPLTVIVVCFGCFLN